MIDLKTALSGPVVLLPTFFRRGELDLDAHSEHATGLCLSGCLTMVVGGAEGEGPTLTEKEHADLLNRLATGVNSTVVGQSIVTSCTGTAIRQAIMAEESGAAYILLSAPPYNKPTQGGVCRHVEAVFAATSLPVVVRDEVGRNRIGFSDETLVVICGFRPAAIAFAPGDFRRASIVQQRSNDDISVLAGSDFDAVLGQFDPRSGWLSSLANVDPVGCRELQAARQAYDWHASTALSRRLCRLLRALELDEPAVAVKHALHRTLGFSSEVRLPLVEAPVGAALVIDAALEAHEFGRPDPLPHGDTAEAVRAWQRET